LVRSYVTRPTTIRAITEMPANTPRPIGSTDSFFPGSVNAAAGAALALAAAAEFVVAAAFAASVGRLDAAIDEVPPPLLPVLVELAADPVEVEVAEPPEPSRLKVWIAEAATLEVPTTDPAKPPPPLLVVPEELEELEPPLFGATDGFPVF